jgi:hypothetical protein
MGRLPFYGTTDSARPGPGQDDAFREAANACRHSAHVRDPRHGGRATPCVVILHVSGGSPQVLRRGSEMRRRIPRHATRECELSRRGRGRGLMVALEPRLARLVCTYVARGLNRLELRIDGVPVRPSAVVDSDSDRPRPYLVEASAPAFESFGAHVTVDREAQTIDVDVPSMQPQPAPRSASPGSTQRIAGVVVGGPNWAD